jgi:hypothetical protein
MIWPPHWGWGSDYLTTPTEAVIIWLPPSVRPSAPYLLTYIVTQTIYIYIYIYSRNGLGQLQLQIYIYIYTAGMAWVNFNFKFLSNIVENCAEELEVDMYSTLVTTMGILVGTFVMRHIVDTYVVPWWIRRKVCTCICVCIHTCVYVYVCLGMRNNSATTLLRNNSATTLLRNNITITLMRAWCMTPLRLHVCVHAGMHEVYFCM